MISRKRDQGSYKYKNKSHEAKRVVSNRKISILISRKCSTHLVLQFFDVTALQIKVYINFEFSFCMFVLFHEKNSYEVQYEKLITFV